MFGSWDANGVASRSQQLHTRVAADHGVFVNNVARLRDQVGMVFGLCSFSIVCGGGSCIVFGVIITGNIRVVGRDWVTRRWGECFLKNVG